MRNFASGLTACVLLLLISLQANSQQLEQLDSVAYKKIVKYLHLGLNKNDLGHIDLKGAYTLKFTSGNQYMLRIPFDNYSFWSDFIILQCDASGNCQNGKIVHLVINQKEGFKSDTMTLYNMKRNKKWSVFYLPADTPDSSNACEEALDPVAIPFINQNRSLTRSYYLNIAAVLNPGEIKRVHEEAGFKFKSAGETSGGFGTYSYYFKVIIDKAAVRDSALTKIEFEKPAP